MNASFSGKVTGTGINIKLPFQAGDRHWHEHHFPCSGRWQTLIGTSFSLFRQVTGTGMNIVLPFQSGDRQWHEYHFSLQERDRHWYEHFTFSGRRQALARTSFYLLCLLQKVARFEGTTNSYKVEINSNSPEHNCISICLYVGLSVWPVNRWNIKRNRYALSVLLPTK